VSSITDETIRISAAVARRILSREVRKALGLYYIIWSTYPIVIALMFTLTYEFSGINALLSLKPLNVPIPLYGILMIAIIVVYGGLAGRFFSRLSKVSKSPELIRYREQRQRINRLLMKAYFAVTIMLALVSYLVSYQSAAFYYIPLLLFIVGVLYVNYNLFRSGIVKVRYYDHLANASFAVIMIIEFTYYFAFYILSLIWIYAGVKSLLEVIEGE